MSEETKTASESKTASRVLYRDSQVLTAPDLLAEQEYLVQMRQRHAVTHHTWGIARGLELSVDGATLRLSPGNGVDGKGRQLIVPASVAAPVADFTVNEVSVWLAYAVEAEADRSRVREVTRLRFTAGASHNEESNTTRPKDLCREDCAIFLGSLQRSAANESYVVKRDARRYVGLVGEVVRAASGGAHMWVTNHFAVGVLVQAGSVQTSEEKLRIDPLGNLSVRADARFTGNVKATTGVTFTRAGIPPGLPSPWRIYRATVAKDAAPSLSQWVVELAGPTEKGDPGGLTASIGHAAEQNFAGRLQVTAGGDVTIAGRVRVGGRMFEGAMASAAGMQSEAPKEAAVSQGPLSVKLDAPKGSLTGSALYTISLANSGDSMALITELQEFVTLNDQLTAGPLKAVPAFSLDPGQNIQFSRVLRVEAAGVLKIGVRVTGTSAHAGAIAASAGRKCKSQPDRMAPMAIERVNYFDQQFLRVQDFADEQAYQIAMRRRHNISHHSWGIVHGLEPQLNEGALWLAAGMAIDGFGRELISDHVQPLPENLFEDLLADELRVWISYSTRTVEEATGGYARCADSPRFYRLSEQVRIEFLRSDPNSTPRKPASILETDAKFDATRTPPENRNWPVFLGTVRANADNPDRPFSIDLAGRPYVGLVGEAVTSPSGGARVQVGAENKADVNRFAVFVPATDPDARLAVEQDGTLMARGDTTLLGDVNIAGGALEIGVGPAVAPQPWRIYRVEQVDPSGAARSELRIEMQGGNGGDNQVVFGAWSAKENKFKPCLTIGDDGTVTVAGNLVVHGKVDAKTGAVVSGDAAAGELPPHMQRIRDLAETISHSEAQHLHAFATLIKTDFKGVAEKLKQLL